MLRESGRQQEYNEFFNKVIPKAMRTTLDSRKRLEVLMRWLTSLSPMPSLTKPGDQALLHELFLDEDQTEVSSPYLRECGDWRARLPLPTL